MIYLNKDKEREKEKKIFNQDGCISFSPDTALASIILLSTSPIGCNKI